MKFDQHLHFLVLSKRCSFMLLRPMPAMTQLIFKESLIVCMALGLVDHDLSLKVCDGVEEVSFKQRSQDLCQLPVTLALLVGSYLLLLTNARQASNPSPSLLVNTTFNAFPVQVRNSAGRSQPQPPFQFGTVPGCKHEVQLRNGGLV